MIRHVSLTEIVEPFDKETPEGKLITTIFEALEESYPNLNARKCAEIAKTYDKETPDGKLMICILEALAESLC